MSLTLALGSAFNGLKANQSQFAILSKNVESAASPHYVRKNAVLTSRIVAGINLGLQVGISRDVDERLIRDVRMQAGENAALSSKVEYLRNWSRIVGQPQDEMSIASTLNNFKISLQTLESSPGSQVDQLNTIRAAEKLVKHVNDLYGQANELRRDADGQIKSIVDQVNSDLKRIEMLNKSISNTPSGSTAGADLLDERDLIADRLAEAIGITTYTRENGDMVVLARGGATLVDGSAVELSYSLMGHLETSDGTILTPNSNNPSGLKAGSLAGLFEVRDEILPDFMAQLDDMASGLIRMFEAADLSLSAGEAGLFTDGGSAFNAANVEGIAGRLRINASVQPSAGGDLGKISSGMSSTGQVPGADATQVTKFLEAFSETMTYGSSPSMPVNSRIEDFAVAMVTTQQNVRTAVEAGHRISSVSLSSLSETRMNRDGVNIDDELMKIQLVEQTYQASSAVLKSVQDMLDTLLAVT